MQKAKRLGRFWFAMLVVSSMLACGQYYSKTLFKYINKLHTTYKNIATCIYVPLKGGVHGTHGQPYRSATAYLSSSVVAAAQRRNNHSGAVLGLQRATQVKVYVQRTISIA